MVGIAEMSSNNWRDRPILAAGPAGFNAGRMPGRGCFRRMLASSLGLAMAMAAQPGWAYVYSASDYATTVVAYTAGDYLPQDFLTGDLFTHPEAALGRPTVDTTADRNAQHSPEPTVPVFPAWRSTELTAVGEGGTLILAFDHPVTHDASNPFGRDLIIFGNTFQNQMLSGPADQGWANGDPAATRVGGGTTSRVGTVSVSSDGVTWYTFPENSFQTGFAPTLGRVYDAAHVDGALGGWNQWWGQPTDPTVPLDPSWTAGVFTGATLKGMAQAYGISAGGVSFDLSTLGLTSIQYVKIENPAGSGGTVSIDAVADVSVNQWGKLAGGSAGAAANWTARSAPNGIGVAAQFRGAIDADATVTLDAATTWGSLLLQSPYAYTLAGPQHLTLQAGSGAASVAVLLGKHTISTPVTFASETTVDIAAGAALTLVSATGAALSKTGSGTFTLGTLTSTGLTIAAGTVQLTDASRVSRLGSCTLDAGAALDLTQQDLIIDGTSSVTIARYIAIGRLFSSTAPAGHVVAMVTAEKYLLLNGQTTFDGQSVAPPDLLLRCTWLGDADMDGVITLSDYAQIDSGFLLHGSGWSSGDFNYDGVVDWRDYALIDAGAAMQGSPLAAEMLQLHTQEFGLGYVAAVQTAVPEPATLAWLLPAAILTVFGRRFRGGA